MPSPAQSRQIMMAKLAVARAGKRTSRVVIVTDNQRQLIALLRSVDPTAVLSLMGTEGVRIHGTHWGKLPHADEPQQAG